MRKKLCLALAALLLVTSQTLVMVQPARAFTITGDPSGWNFQGTLEEVLCDYFKTVFCKSQTEY